MAGNAALEPSSCAARCHRSINLPENTRVRCSCELSAVDAFIDKLSQASEISSIQKTLESQAFIFSYVIKMVLSYQVSTLKLYKGSIKSILLKLLPFFKRWLAHDYETR